MTLTDLIHIERVNRDKNYNWKSLYRCVCGVEFVAYDDNVRSGKTTSCGCVRANKATTHGQSRTLTYYSWIAMKQRCYNKNYSSYDRYGGRGIVMSEDWQSFEQFHKDMGDRPGAEFCIDRIDNDGPYCRNNCRWITRSENSRRCALLHGLGRRIYGDLD